jgi:hypothetical protein
MVVHDDTQGLSGFLEYRKLNGTWRPFLFQTVGHQLVLYRVHVRASPPCLLQFLFVLIIYVGASRSSRLIRCWSCPLTFAVPRKLVLTMMEPRVSLLRYRCLAVESALLTCVMCFVRS